MDISQTTVPDSTQVNAEDFLSGPRTVTIAAVREGTAQQPVNIDLVEFPGRAYRPNKTMRRVIEAAWGRDTDAYAGRRMTLYRDPEVTFGRDTPGGIKISNLSHIDRTITIALTVTRGRRAPVVVEPLPQTPQGESPRGATQGVDLAAPGAGPVEGAGVGASSTPPPAGGITPDHERVIKEHMVRAGISSAGVMELARQAAGRDLASARDLSSVEADALVVLLAELPDAPQDGA